MLFGTLEILLCLAPVMLVIFAIGVSLAAQNKKLDRKEQWRRLIACPHCHKALNPEAYICRFCRKELYEFIPK